MCAKKIGIVWSRREFLRNTVLAGSGLLLAGCGTTKEQAPAGETEKELTEANIRLGWIKNVQFAGIMMAMEKGYFKDEGIDAKLQPGGSGIDPIPLVTNGSDLFGIATSGGSMITARSKGVPIKALASWYQKHPFSFISRKEDNITKPEDFIGKRVGIQNESMHYLEAVTKKYNIPINKIEIIASGYDITPLITKQVDVYTGWVINQPYFLEKANMEWNAMLVADLGFRYYAIVPFVSNETFTKNPDVVVSFLRATRRGWENVIANPDEATQVVVEKYGKDLDLGGEKWTLNQVIPLLKSAETEKNGFGWMEKDVWQLGIDTYFNYKQITKSFDASEVMDTTLLQKSYQG